MFIFKKFTNPLQSLITNSKSIWGHERFYSVIKSKRLKEAWLKYNYLGHK